jgi:hypothetical protein
MPAAPVPHAVRIRRLQDRSGQRLPYLVRLQRGAHALSGAVVHAELRDGHGTRPRDRLSDLQLLQSGRL